MNKITTRKLAIAGVLIAVGVVCSPLNFPVGASKLFSGATSYKHNCVSIFRTVLRSDYGIYHITSSSCNGYGYTFLHFRESMCGALIGGLCYKFSKKLPLAYIGELFGTGIIGALAAYPIAVTLWVKRLHFRICTSVYNKFGRRYCYSNFSCTALKQTHALDKIFRR